VSLVARYGHRFLPLYRFDVHSGAWSHKQDNSRYDSLSLEAAIAAAPARPTAMDLDIRARIYESYLAEARDLAANLCDAYEHDCTLAGELGELQFFALDERSAGDGR
jgi:hypothetical protein